MLKTSNRSLIYTGRWFLQNHYVQPSYELCQRRNWATATAASSGSDTIQIPKPVIGGPLHGVRVLDLTRILAGPYCTMILGDMGAEIIKVERPGTGDDTRTWGPPYVNDFSCYFVCVNRNKKSLALNMKKGAHLIKKLVQECDVLIENFVPGSMDKLGLSYEELAAKNSGLIYCSISGYGSTGPYMGRGGYDVIAAGLGGLMHITGPRDGEPCKVGVAMTDLATGLYAHGAILAALLERNTTKKGQRIECNLLSTQISCLANLASNYLNCGIEASRLGTEHESIVPYQTFKTKDGRYITIGAGNNSLFHEFCDKLDLPELKTNPKYATNELRVKNRVELLNIISTTLESRTLKEWLDVLENSKLPYGPVNDINHAFADPQVQHNKMVREMGPYKVVGPPVKYSSSKNEPRIPPPHLGQHTREILSDLIQLSDQEISDLYTQSIVQ